jgi:folate-binding protein YgfZ
MFMENSGATAKNLRGKMKIYKTFKQVLSFKSQNVEQFFKGLTSNTLEAPRNAFLTVHAKIIATFDQIKISDIEHWIIIEKPFADGLLAHLDKYMKLSQVKSEKLNLNVYFDLDNSYSLLDEEKSVVQKNGKIIITNKDLKANVSEDECTLFRLNNNIALHGVDYKDEMLLNVSLKEFVSYTKGCFLGQEPVAKVYNRSKPTWRLVVKKERDCSEEEKLKMTSKIIDSHGDVIGFVFEKNN